MCEDGKKSPNSHENAKVDGLNFGRKYVDRDVKPLV